MVLADKLAIAGLLVSTFGFALAVWTLEKGNRNASAGAVLTLNENFRSAWARWCDAAPDKKNYELHDLLNLVEVATTLYNDRAYAGRSKGMMEKYLKSILNLMDSSETMRAALRPMQDELDTFEHTKRFCRKFRIQLFD
jgi:hypothetical protein